MWDWTTFIRSRLSDVTEGDDFYSGYIDGTDNFKAFLNDSETTGYKFVTRCARLGCGSLYFQNAKKNESIQIPFFGPIYMHKRYTTYDCCLGAKRNHQKKVDPRHSDQPSGKKPRRKPSKKIGCPATMHVAQIRVFPEYAVDQYAPKGSKLQTKIVKELKAVLAASRPSDGSSFLSRKTASDDQPRSQPPEQDSHDHPQSQNNKEASDETPRSQLSEKAANDQPQSRSPKKESDDKPPSPSPKKESDDKPPSRSPKTASDDKPQSRLLKKASGGQPQSRLSKKASDGKTRSRLSKKASDDQLRSRSGRIVKPSKKVLDSQAQSQRSKDTSGDQPRSQSPKKASDDQPQPRLSQKARTQLLKKPPRNCPKPASFDRYIVRVSKESVHCHPANSSSSNQTLHPELSSEIQSLVKRRMCSVKEIRLHLQEYVQKKVASSDWPAPDPSNHSFYPTYMTVYNHMYKTIIKGEGSKFDQEALEQYVSNVESASPDDAIFFRPYKQIQTENDNSSEEIQVEVPLLFCHQTYAQKHLLNRYGGNICLLDATYRTTKHSLPLYFLTVKTNVGYSVVGSFVIHMESAELIQEALEHFASWNPTWNPSYFMTDFSQAEINAIEHTFPSAVVYLCAFHREQAWHRWLHLKENDVPVDSRATLKQLWRTIAASKTVDEFEENVTAMTNTEVYSVNIKVQNYFENEWLTEAHRWVEAFQTKQFLANVNMANGVESQNRILNHKYLSIQSDKSLSGLVRMLIEEYLPSALENYARANVPCKSACPDFLINRPMHFVKHVMKHHNTASKTYHSLNISLITENIYAVTSEEDSNAMYVVDLNAPSCSCLDFEKWRFPCKHLCAIFLHVPGKSFSDLPGTYRNNPFMTIDDMFYLVEDTTESMEVNHQTAELVEIEVKESMEMDDDNYGVEIIATETNDASKLKVPSQEMQKATAHLRELLKKAYDQTYLVVDKQCVENAISNALAITEDLASGITESSEVLPNLVADARRRYRGSPKSNRKKKVPSKNVERVQNAAEN